MTSCRKSLSDIILIGGPGSGKTTFAELLSTKLSAIHLNMGALLRHVVKVKGPHYQIVKQCTTTGALVPEKISTGLIKDFVSKVKSTQRIIFDGYPRRMSQVRNLEKLQTNLGRQNVLVLIDVPLTVARNRIVNRAKLEGRADDSNPTVVTRRINVFKKNSQPVINFYKKRHAFIKINNNRPLQIVKQDILKQVKSL